MADRQDDNDEPDTTRAAPLSDDPTLVAGRYRIVRTLGRGGGGHVWLATDEKLGREVALKRVSGETDAEVLLTRGFREARTSATLAHEHVVRVYDAFEHEGSPWIVMEYVDGRSLAELTQDGGRLPVQQVAAVGAQMATALAAAHRAGILHRDVKPANVLLAGEGGTDAKLTDFGIARADEDPQLTRTGFVSGTAAYFSPELARGDQPTAASDVWALGATLYAAVEGQRPFPERPNAVAQLHTIVNEQVRPPQHAGALAPVLAGMLDPDPAARWDAAHAARELGRVAQQDGTTEAPAAASAAAVPAPRDGDSGHTQAVPQADPTRTFARTEPRDHQRADPVSPPPTGADEPRSSAATHRPSGARRPGRRGRGTWLAWLVAIPLVLLLGWLVWTIANGDIGGGAGPTTSSEQTGPVAAGEAQSFVEDFYAALEGDGQEAAREFLGPDAYMAPDISEGLGEVSLADVEATEQADGTAVVTAVVSYGYSSTLVQDEALTVARTDDGLRIVTRSALERGGDTQDSDDEGGASTEDD